MRLLRQVYVFIESLVERGFLFILGFLAIGSFPIAAIALIYIFIYLPVEVYFDKKTREEKNAQMAVDYPITKSARFDHLITHIADVDEECIDSFSGKKIKNDSLVYIWYLQLNSRQTVLSTPKRPRQEVAQGMGFNRDVAPNFCEPYSWEIPKDNIKLGASFDLDGECLRRDNAYTLLDKIYPKPNMKSEIYFGSSEEEEHQTFNRAYPASCKVTFKTVNNCFRDDQLTPTNSHISGYEEGRILSRGGVNDGRYIDHYRCNHPSNKEFMAELRRKRDLSTFQ